MWRIILLLSCFFCSTVFADTYKSSKIGKRKPVVPAKMYKSSKPDTRKYYTGFEAGYSYTLGLNNKFKAENVGDAGQLGFFLGTVLTYNYRVEIEGNYKTKHTAKSPVGTLSAEQQFESFTSFVNLYKSWNYNNSELIQPFIMAGVGASYNVAGDYKTMTNSTTIGPKILGTHSYNFAYQVGLGVSTQLNRDAYLDFSVRYADRGKADTTNISISNSGVISTVDKEKSKIRDVVGLVNVRFYL